MEQEPVVTVGKDNVYPLIFTPENLKRFWEQARKFPVIYGHEIVDNHDAFIDLFFDRTPSGIFPKGLFWVMNDFTGVIYLTNMKYEGDVMVDGLTHYTFFDRRHHGRAPLMREMIKYVFGKYNFVRLSAEIPNYATAQARHFAQEIGFSYEGKRRNSALYKGTWYGVNLYGILKSEVLNGEGN